VGPQQSILKLAFFLSSSLSFLLLEADQLLQAGPAAHWEASQASVLQPPHQAVLSPSIPHRRTGAFCGSLKLRSANIFRWLMPGHNPSSGLGEANDWQFGRAF
jgi:hypothetical protein